jgi:hypothetical protein
MDGMGDMELGTHLCDECELALEVFDLASQLLRSTNSAKRRKIARDFRARALHHLHGAVQSPVRDLELSLFLRTLQRMTGSSVPSCGPAALLKDSDER